MLWSISSRTGVRFPAPPLENGESLRTKVLRLSPFLVGARDARAKRIWSRSRYALAPASLTVGRPDVTGPRVLPNHRPLTTDDRLLQHRLVRQKVVGARRLAPLLEDELGRECDSEKRHRQYLLRLNQERHGDRLILIQTKCRRRGRI